MAFEKGFDREGRESVFTTVLHCGKRVIMNSLNKRHKSFPHFQRYPCPTLRNWSVRSTNLMSKKGMEANDHRRKLDGVQNPFWEETRPHSHPRVEPHYPQNCGDTKATISFAANPLTRLFVALLTSLSRHLDKEYLIAPKNIRRNPGDMQQSFLGAVRSRIRASGQNFHIEGSRSSMLRKLCVAHDTQQSKDSGGGDPSLSTIQTTHQYLLEFFFLILMGLGEEIERTFRSRFEGRVKHHPAPELRERPHIGEVRVQRGLQLLKKDGWIG
jgi:hypothetical protein